MHEQKMMEIRAAIPKRKQHRQRVEAAKKAVKEFLILTGIGIALGLAFLYALDSDTYEPPKPEPRMIKAIGGDYYYPEDQYDEYLKERAAYIEQEEKYRRRNRCAVDQKNLSKPRRHSGIDSCTRMVSDSGSRNRTGSKGGQH